MNVNPQKMGQYAEFLNENSRKIVALCNQLEESLFIAVQCMDQQSGRRAAQRLTRNLENIKANVPISEDTSKRLLLAKKYINLAERTFGG